VLTWGVVNATGLYIGLNCVITRDINDNSPNILDCKALETEDLFFCINLPFFCSGKDSKNQASAVLRSTFTFYHPRRSWKRMAKPSGDGNCREYLRVLFILRPFILFIGILGLFGSNVLIWDLPIVVVPCLLWYVKLVKHDAPHDQQELNMLLKQIRPHLYLMATYLGVRLLIFATVLLLRIFKMLIITSIALVTTMCIALGTLTLFNKKWKHDHAGIVSLLRERLEALGYEQESTSVEIGLYIVAQIALVLTTTQQVLWTSIPGAVQLLVSVASWPYTLCFLHLSSLKQILGSIFDKISAGSKTFEYRAIKLDKGIRLVTLHRRLPYLQVQIRLEDGFCASLRSYILHLGRPQKDKEDFCQWTAILYHT